MKEQLGGVHPELQYRSASDQGSANPTDEDPSYGHAQGILHWLNNARSLPAEEHGGQELKDELVSGIEQTARNERDKGLLTDQDLDNHGVPH